MKHRGPDSTGFAAVWRQRNGRPLCSPASISPSSEDADGVRGYHVQRARSASAIAEIDSKRLAERGVVGDRIKFPDQRMLAMRYVISDLTAIWEKLAGYLEDIEGRRDPVPGERSLELIKDLGDAGEVGRILQPRMDSAGTHAIGHTRMATESDVDIRSAHPYWAFPYNDIAVVHNGQITNYWLMRREIEGRRRPTAGGRRRCRLRSPCWLTSTSGWPRWWRSTRITPRRPCGGGSSCCRLGCMCCSAGSRSSVCCAYCRTSR